MKLTAHVVQRCTQRGIRTQQNERLIGYGSHTWNRGARVYYFDRGHFQRLLVRLGAAERELVEKTRNCYVEVSTVGHREAAFCASKPGAYHHRGRDWRNGEARAA